MAAPEIDAPFVTRQVFFKLFPNPVQDELYLDFYQPIGQVDSRIEVYDFSGHLVKQQVLAKGTLQHNINVNVFPSGMYLLRYMAEGQIWQEEKIIIQY